MFSRRVEEAPVALYGKLPLAKDYLRLGFGAGGSLRFREWLDQGYSGASEPPTVAGPMEFVAGASWDAGLVGVICPSSDAGGLRPFPFVMGIERKPKRIVLDCKRGLLEAGHVHDELIEIFGTLDEADDGQALLAGMRGRTITIDTKAEPPSEAVIPLDAWIAGAWPERGRAGLDAVLSELSRLGRSGYSGPLRLPLVPNLNMRGQARAWLFVLERLGLSAGAEAPSFFYPAMEGESVEGWGSFVCFLGAARTEFSLWLRPEGPGASATGDLLGTPVSLPMSPAPENAPPLVDSLRAIVTAHQVRSD